MASLGFTHMQGDSFSSQHKRQCHCNTIHTHAKFVETSKDQLHCGLVIPDSLSMSFPSHSELYSTRHTHVLYLTLHTSAHILYIHTHFRSLDLTYVHTLSPYS